MTIAATFTYSHTVGFLANQGRGFNNPIDVALDSEGVLYVLNRGGPELGVRLAYKRVTICTVDQEYLGEFCTGGMDDGELWWPSALAFDSKDRLYIADEFLQRVCQFSKEGQLLCQWGTEGSDDGQFNRPSAIAVDSEDVLYVTDSMNHRVQKFTGDGRFIGKWGQPGDGAGQFNMPWGIAVDNHGDVYVADWRNDRVQKFDPTGTFLNEWGRPGDDEGQFHRPAGVAVDSDGMIYVADWGNERVQVLSPDGRVLAVLRGASEEPQWATDYFLANPDEAAARQQANLEPVLDPPAESNREESANIEKLLWGPTAVKVDNHGRIYIVDSCRHRLQIYSNAG